MSAAELGEEARPTKRTARKWEAADSVILGSGLLVSAIVGIFVVLCFQGYDTTVDEARAKANRSASIAAEGARWVVTSSLSLLEGVTSQLDNGAEAAEVLASFERAATPLPAQLDFGVYDASGQLLEGTSTADAPTSIAGRPYLEPGPRGWTVGPENSGSNGASSIAISKSATTGNVGVIFVDAGVLRSIAEPNDLGPNSTISFVRDDGWIIARNPPLAESTNLSGTEAMTRLLGAESGSYVSADSPVDGIARIVGFRHVPELGIIAVASVSTETALAGLWYSIWVVSLLLAPIAIVLLIGSFLTARLLRRTQAGQRSLAAALEHNEELFREIHHRVKNNLQSINSLLQIHPIPREVRADMSKRIFAMSAVHEHIYRSKAFADVRVKDYLHTLITSIRDGADPRISVVEDIDDIIVDKDAAAPLGLILNEVLTNSFKHAFREGEGGTIWVSLKLISPGKAALEVRDTGKGFDPTAPSKGIGRRLIDGFALQLRGTVSHRQEGGYVFTVQFPGTLAG